MGRTGKRIREKKWRVLKTRRQIKIYDRYRKRHETAERASKQTNMVEDRHENNHPGNNTAKTNKEKEKQRFYTKEKEGEMQTEEKARLYKMT